MGESGRYIYSKVAGENNLEALKKVGRRLVFGWSVAKNESKGQDTPERLLPVEIQMR